MKAYRIRAGRGIDSLALAGEAPAPLGAGQVRLRVRAVSLNFRDLMVADGRYPAGGERAVIPASDAVAEVIELGPGATRWALGDRVATSFFPHWHAGAASAHATREPFGADADGVLAEQIVVSQDSVFAVPAHLDDAQAATLTCAGVTAWNALFVEAGLRPGQSVLLLGTGGVSIWALQLAKAAGLRVIITSSDDRKLQRARELGADETINYGSQDLREALKALTAGRGPDIVYDPVGGDLAEAAFRSIAWRGRYLVIGFAQGAIPSLPFNLPLLKGASVVGVFWGDFVRREPAANARALAELAGWYAQGKIKPIIDTVLPMSELPTAYRRMAERAIKGKLVMVNTA